jgi:FixJ family two-component response regulator
LIRLRGRVEALSGRELEVLRLPAAGKPNREIAEELYVLPVVHAVPVAKRALPGVAG